MQNRDVGPSPIVSVLMPVFNCAPYVAQAIDSILNQTLGDLELIIIDDGSTDSSWQIITAYAARDSRIRASRLERNSGKAVALNRGMLLSRGAYITWQDADDISAPERLELQVGFLEAHPQVGVVGTAATMIKADGTPLWDSFDDVSRNEEIQDTLLDRMCLCGPTLLVGRKWYERAGFLFDEVFSISMDYDLCLRLAEVTEIANLVEPLYYYRQHGSSLSSTKRFRQMYNKALALERAVYRRYGPEPTVEQFGFVGRDYLRAAVLGFASDQEAEAKEALARALRFNSTILETREPIETIVTKYAPATSVEEALAFTKRVFDELLPSRRHLTRSKARLMARLHMQEVFAAVESEEPERVTAHLYHGIRQDPTWLFNRGVASLVARQALRLR